MAFSILAMLDMISITIPSANFLLGFPDSSATITKVYARIGDSSVTQSNAATWFTDARMKDADSEDGDNTNFIRMPDISSTGGRFYAIWSSEELVGIDNIHADSRLCCNVYAGLYNRSPFRD